MQALLENQLDLKLRTRVIYLKSENTILNKENKENIKSFYDFCKKFFSLWEKYLERISPLISEFKNKQSSIGSKQIFADIIAEQYGKYLNDLTNLKVQSFLDKAFNLFLNSIKYKRIFFNLYCTNPNNKELDNIKNESKLNEEQFWLEIYRKNLEIEDQLIGKNYFKKI